MAGPSPMQALILWALVAHGGEAAQKDFQPALGKPDRDALIRLGFIAERRGPRRAILVELTDRGWAWAGEGTRAPLSASKAGAVVLAHMLERLQAFLAARDLTLAEFIRPGSARESAPAASPSGPDVGEAASGEPADLPARIRAAYLDITGGAVKRRVRLADMRARLPDVPATLLHGAMLAMQAQGAAGLLRQEDPTRLTPEDAAAALHVAGEPRHYLWLD